MRRSLKRAFAVVMAAIMMLPASAALGEAAAPDKEEVVYAMLDGSGKATGVYVVNIFDVTDAGSFKDHGAYALVVNLTNTDRITLEKDLVAFDAPAGRYYYQGYMASPELPWNIAIGYTLDGRSIAAEEAAGASGRLGINIKTSCNKAVDATFFDHYMLQISVTLDTEICRRIAAPGATIANAGTSKILTFTVLPGSEADIAIDAIVTDFEMEGISINGVKYNLDLDDIDISSFTGKLSDLKEGVEELDDGMAELKKGAGSLEDGAKQLNGGMSDAHTGMAEFTEGVKGFTDGVGELGDGVDAFGKGLSAYAAGAGEFADGVAELDDGITALQGGMDELSGGLYTLAQTGGSVAAGGQALADALLVMANAQLHSVNPTLPALTWDNYAAIFDSMTDMAALREQARQTIADGSGLSGSMLDALLYLASKQGDAASDPESALGAAGSMLLDAGAVEAAAGALAAAGGNPLAVANVSAVMAGIAASSGGAIGSAGEAYAAIRAQLGSATDAEAALLIVLACDEAVSGTAMDEALINASVKAQNAALVQAAIAAVAGGDPGFGGSIDAFLTALVAARGGSGLSQLADLYAMLSGAHEFAAGLGAYTAGVCEASSGVSRLAAGLMRISEGTAGLSAGAKKLADGANDLNGGAQKLADGADELAGGADTLYRAAATLRDGMGALGEGTHDLADGVGALYDGIGSVKDGTAEFRENTATMDDDIEAEVNAMLGGSGDEDAPNVSFVSPKNANVASVQFVFKTAAIELQKAEIPPEVTAPMTLWQRILALFNLYQPEG